MCETWIQYLKVTSNWGTPLSISDHWYLSLFYNNYPAVLHNHIYWHIFGLFLVIQMNWPGLLVCAETAKVSCLGGAMQHHLLIIYLVCTCVLLPQGCVCTSGHQKQRVCCLILKLDCCLQLHTGWKENVKYMGLHCHIASYLIRANYLSPKTH